MKIYTLILNRTLMLSLCSGFVYSRPVFACIGLTEGDLSWERSFSRWPWGVCEQLVPVKAPFDPEKWAQKTLDLYNWSQPHDR